MPCPTTAFSIMNQTRMSDYVIKFKGIRIPTLSIPSSHTLITASQEPRIMAYLNKLKQKTVQPFFFYIYNCLIVVSFYRLL